MSDNKKDDTDLGIQVLVVFGLILPLFGSVWGPGPFWQYLLWFLGGCVLVSLAMHFLEQDEKGEGPPA